MLNNRFYSNAKWLCCLIMLLYHLQLFAQNEKIAFEKYGVAEGLPEEYVSDVIQDDKGFIWFSTQNGLVKYDGYRFQVFKAVTDKKDTTSLQLRNLNGGLLKARDGKIWMGSYSETGGVASFDPATGKFRNYYPDTDNVEISEDVISYLFLEDGKGNIWFQLVSYLTGESHIFRLDPVTQLITRYPVTGNDQSFNNVGVLAESSNSIWLLDDQNNLNRWNTQNDSFEIVIPAGSPVSSGGRPDTIQTVMKGSENRLLLTSAQGFYVFDSKNQKVIRSYFNFAETGNKLPAAPLIYAFEDLNGKYWAMHLGGNISLIDPVTDGISTFIYGSAPLFFSGGPEEMSGFWLSSQNKEGLWFQALNEFSEPVFFMYYNFDTKAFRFYDGNFNFSKNPMPQAPYLYGFLEDRTGLLWLGTRPGLYKQASLKRQMDLYQNNRDDANSLPSDSIRFLFEDSKQRLWIGTLNGLAVYQPGQDNFLVFRSDPSNAGSLSNSRIQTITEDATGKIWVATQNGLNLWQESTNSFKRFFYNPGEINNCRFVFTDIQQRLWLSVWNKGVFVLDPKTGEILKSYIPDFENPASLSSKQVDRFFEDSGGIIWLGDRGENAFGLYRLNEQEDGFVHYLPVPGDSTSISSNEILFIAEDGKKRLWVGTDGGLNVFDRELNRFARYDDRSLASVSGYANDNMGEPWFGTYASGGLVSVNVESGKITAYGEEQGLLHIDLGIIGRIAMDKFGRLWLPNQRGLSVFDPEEKLFTNYYEKDGFQPYDRRYATLKASNGDIWIGGFSNGLNRIIPDNLLKKDSTLAAVVITQITIDDSVYTVPDGEIFTKAVAYTHDFKLQYWQKDLDFEFVALHYLRSEDNQYSWKLENYDKDWSAPSKQRKASYTNLSPGTYIFHVRASNANGVWNEEGTSITFAILPPWWLTKWAYGFYILLLVAAVFGVDRIMRDRLIQKERERSRAFKLEQAKKIEKAYDELKSTQSQLIQSEKMASLGELTAGIAHEIQNPLNFVNNFAEVSIELIDEMKQESAVGGQRSAVGGQQSAIEIMDDIRQNLDKILHHGKRADAIVKGMLQHSRTSSGQKEPTDINELADEYLRLAYHGLRAKDKTFNAAMKTDFDESIGNINVIPQDIGRVILNLIINAFYAVGEKKKQMALDLSGLKTLTGLKEYEPTVTVSTKRSLSSEGESLSRSIGSRGEVVISVKDNGNGIPEHIKDKIFQPFFTTKPTGQGTGLGLSLSYDIVKAHGGELKVETKEGEGAEFIICIPV